MQYPDGTWQTSDYDALGEVISQVNRDTSEHYYRYDTLGRQIMDTVATFAPFVDHTVRALGTTYDTLGHVILATSYGWGSPPAVVNQVENVYDGLGNLVTQYQSLSGPVNTTTSPYTPAVQYQYTTCYAGAGNYSRLTGITYPGGTQVSYAYAGLNDLDDAISRITSVSDGGQMVESYRYLGLSTVIGATLPEPSINETVSLDNFGNVADIAWTQGGTFERQHGQRRHAAGQRRLRLQFRGRGHVAAGRPGRRRRGHRPRPDLQLRFGGAPHGLPARGRHVVRQHDDDCQPYGDRQLVVGFRGQPL